MFCTQSTPSKSWRFITKNECLGTKLIILIFTSCCIKCRTWLKKRESHRQSLWKVIRDQVRHLLWGSQYSTYPIARNQKRKRRRSWRLFKLQILLLMRLGLQRRRIIIRHLDLENSLSCSMKMRFRELRSKPIYLKKGVLWVHHRVNQTFRSFTWWRLVINLLDQHINTHIFIKDLIEVTFTIKSSIKKSSRVWMNSLINISFQKYSKFSNRCFWLVTFSLE